MAYIAIDKVNLAVRHKHTDRSVVTGLAYIELSHVAAAVQEVSGDADWESFSDYELKRLYESMTGHRYEGYSRPRLLELVTHAALALEDTDADAGEVAAQVAGIEPTDRGFYRYSKGSRRAAQLQGLFVRPACTALTVPPDAVPAGGRERTPAAITPAATPATPPQPRAPRAPSNAPRTGSRAIIFEVADRMWGAAGSPKDIGAVLALRKQIMTTLETEHDIKKTTSSTALGEWQKVRLN